MTFFERIVGGDIFAGIWSRMRQFVFKENRWRQLFSLEPIEIYTTDTELEFDQAKVQLQVKAFLENLVQRRIVRGKDLFNLEFLTRPFESPAYTFNVHITAKASYADVSAFFTHNFGFQTYEIVNDKYRIELEDFRASSEGTKAVVVLPFYIHARFLFIRFKRHGTATFRGSLTFNNPPYTIRTRNLDYTLQTGSWLLKLVDWRYRRDRSDWSHRYHRIYRSNRTHRAYRADRINRTDWRYWRYGRYRGDWSYRNNWRDR